MDEKIVLSYFSKAIKGNKITGNVYAAFTYGNPEGRDFDLCVVCDLPEKLPEPENNLINMKKVTPEKFETMLKEHGKNAVELRVVPTSIFGAYVKENFRLRPENETKAYLENMLKYCDIKNVKVSDLKVKQ